MNRRNRVIAHRSSLIALILLAFASCGRLTSAPSNKTPVILISIDTLRSDRLPVYGYKGVATPNIDALRADGILYERAYSHTPLTLPSHASMLTGKLPADNGIRDNIGFVLDAKIPTLPELLKKNGYATGGAISAYVLRRETGIARGFDVFDDEVEPIGASATIGRVQRIGEETLASARKWLVERGEDEPFFLFLHTYDPHTPYTPPEPFRSRYKDAYDGEIAYSDQVVGDLISDLKQKGIYDKALIILLSDHGEGLNDHGEEEHGIFLYREAIQVPLIVKLPGNRSAGRSVSKPAALVDVFPTILEQTATPIPPGKSEAVSLLSLMESDAPSRTIYSETYYPKLHFGWSDLHSMIDGEHHYIRAPIPELYDLGKDPGEKKNAIEENRRKYVALRAAIEPYVREAAAPTAIDPDDAAKLAALGYIGSSAAPKSGEALPDPKTTIGVFQEIRVAFTRFREERLEETLAICDRLLRDNDSILDLWDLKSKALGKLGRTQEAIDAAKEGLRRQPNTVALLSAVANLSILTGNLDDAERHAELLLKPEPGQAHELLARIYAERKDYARAEKEARAAMSGGRDSTPALMTLGLIEKQKGDLDASIRYLDEALANVRKKRNQRIPNLHFYRGDVLARLGRVQEAEGEFRQEIAAYPTHPDAYTSLILLLSANGRPQDATQLVFDLVKAAPHATSYIAISETLAAIGDGRGALYWAHQGAQKFPADRELQKMVQQMRSGRAAA
jgi:arylsulfatase A-like enzyme/Flp pilus assembly protein TadD